MSTNSNAGSVTRLAQSSFEEGVQELNVYLETDQVVPQKWKWPEVRREGDAGSYSLHDVYVQLFEAGMEPDELYLFVTTAAQQVGGQTLSQAQPIEGAGGDDLGEGDDTGTGDETDVTGDDDASGDGSSDEGDGEGTGDDDTSNDAGEEEE